MNLTIECEVTEYAVVSDMNYIYNSFNLNEKSMVVSFCNADSKVITQSEISKDDAIQLARFIISFYS